MTCLRVLPGTIAVCRDCLRRLRYWSGLALRTRTILVVIKMPLRAENVNPAARGRRPGVIGWRRLGIGRGNGRSSNNGRKKIRVGQRGRPARLRGTQDRRSGVLGRQHLRPGRPACGPVRLRQRGRLAYLRPSARRQCSMLGKSGRGADACSGLRDLCGAERGRLAHTCGVLKSGALSCWGAGRFQAVSSGTWHTCALRKETGSVACFGDDAWGRSSAPSGWFVSLDAGAWHTCGVREGGRTACWGRGPSR